MQPQEEEEKLGKTKSIILTDPRDRKRGYAGPHRQTPGWSGGRRRESWQSVGLCLHWGFCGKSKPGQETKLGLASLNNFSGL